MRANSVRIWKHLAKRIVVVSVIFAAVTLSTLSDRVPGNELGMDEAIAAATGLYVKPGTTALLGDSRVDEGAPWRTAVMLASSHSQAPADLYCVEVKLRSDRSLLSARRWYNLSSTPQADEQHLVVRNDFAAVTTFSLGQARAVTLFDFRGATLSTEATWDRVTLVLARLSNLLETGRLAGVGKTTLRFSRPPSSLAIQLAGTPAQGDALHIAWKDPAGNNFSANVNPTDVAGTAPSSLAIAENARLPKSPVLWLVDTVRSLRFIGSKPIEWAEGRFFAAKDTLRRFAWRHGLVSEEQNAESSPSSTSGERRPIAVPAGLTVGQLDEVPQWPPRTLDPPVFSRRSGGEGEWRPGSPEFRRQVLEGDDVIYRTYLRTDSLRPYVKVELFALDMRRLSLHMVAGLEDPEPTTGSQGTGIIPRDPDLMPRVVAAWNGAFKTLHGAYGMVAESDVLLPPKDEAATIASFNDGRAVMGSWPKAAPLPNSIVSLRQNMDPLVEAGVVNPRGRYLWGFTLDEDISSMNTIRSGVCMTEGGHLVYAWGEDLTATTLAVAMNAAGCVYGMHLDMNPFHTSFIHYRFDPLEAGEKPVFDAQLAMPAMRYSLQRYVFASPKDFFYVALKEQGPGPAWSAAGLAQPAPADVPAVFSLRRDACRLVAVDLSRARLFLSSGEVPTHLLPAPVRLAPLDASLLLATARLRLYNAGLGQVSNTATVAPMIDGTPTIALGDGGELLLGPWSAAHMTNSTPDAVQSSSSATGDEPVLRVGLAQNRYLILGEGPASALASIMTEVGAAIYVTFSQQPEHPSLLVRAEAGMSDASGTVVSELDTMAAVLHVIAQPRPLGMQRLEPLVAPQAAVSN